MKRQDRIIIKRLLFIVIVSIFALGVSVILSNDPVDAHMENTGRERGSGVLDRCKYYTSIEVSAGDSLWSIAEEYISRFMIILMRLRRSMGLSLIRFGLGNI